MGKNIIQDTNKRIAELEQRKAADISSIEKQLQRISDAIADQEKKAANAAENMNDEDYSNATAAKAKLEVEASMFNDRLKQIQGKEMVTAEESEATIAALLSYEKELEAKFAEALAQHLKAIKELTDKQRADASEAENTLREWTQRIRPNYISEGTTYADGTNRSPVPVPIHPMGYFGGGLVSRIDDFLTYGDIAKLINED